jgi:hypothetical protein
MSHHVGLSSFFFCEGEIFDGALNGLDFCIVTGDRMPLQFDESLEISQKACTVSDPFTAGFGGGGNPRCALPGMFLLSAGSQELSVLLLLLLPVGIAPGYG